jgi:adenylate cyclase
VADDDAPQPKKKKAALEKVAQTDTNPQLLKVARWVRQRLPGDTDFGDALSTAGDEPSLVLARRLSELGAERPSAMRELGLGALQVWQGLAEAQGRGRGTREVTILFTDLVEFSAWALEVGDDPALELLRRVGACEEEAVTGHDGRVVKRLGDGMMAVFNDAASAVRAACEAREKVATVSAEGYQAQIRAGVHLRKPRKIGGDYLGVDVNIAARVAEQAKGGEVLISEPTCETLDLEGLSYGRARRLKAEGAPRDLRVRSVSRAAS